MKKKELPTDPDFLGAIEALKRSAASALKLARQTKTPCYVMKDGKIVDIAARRAKAPKKAVRCEVADDPKADRTAPTQGIGSRGSPSLSWI